MESLFGGSPTLQDKVATLRTQLGLPTTDALVVTIDKAIEQLGLDGELKGQNLSQKVDACLSTLGAKSQSEEPLIMATEIVMTQPAMAQPVMPTVVAQPVVPMAVAEPVVQVMQREVVTGLAIVEARYGWAFDIWGAGLGSDHNHGAGAKDVTAIVRGLIVNDELRIKVHTHSGYWEVAAHQQAGTFWPETSGGPAIPRKLAVRFSYDGGPTVTVETPAVPNETVPLHVTRTTLGGGAGSEFHGMIATKDIEGCWICCCFPFMCSACFKKEMTGPDTLKHVGCWNGGALSSYLLLCPFEEHRMRVPGTNNFVKADGNDPDVYSSSGCACRPNDNAVCSMKVC